MNPYFKKIKFKHFFIFVSAYFIPYFVFFFYDQYTFMSSLSCIFTVKKEKRKKEEDEPLF